MHTALVIILVITICILWYSWYMYSRRQRDEALRERYRALLDDSTGAYDDAAADAEFTIGAIDNPTSEDELHAGIITDLNRNLGDIRNATPVERANTFAHYTRALELIDNNTPDPIWTVDFIAGFIDRNAEAVFANPVAAPLLHTYNDVSPGVRKRMMEQARGLAAQTAANPTERVAKTLDNVKTHTSDPQNVHDSAVNTSLRRTVTRIRDTTRIASFGDCAAEASAWINRCGDTVKRERAQRALASLSVPSFNSTIGCSDADVFAMVWSRHRVERNVDNADRIRDAVVDSLADFYERRHGGTGDNPVCVNGRCGRMLESLVLVDHDDSLGGALTLEQHRNDIIEQVKTVLAREISAAKNSDDADMRAVAEAYEGSSTPVDAAAENRFKESIRREIDVIVDSKRDVLGSAAENVRADAYAAID